MNDPKYITGPIINSASGEAIPQDEPVFLFRARDNQALNVLEFYWELVNEDPDNAEHANAVRRRIEEFYTFKETHPERMKRPDTDLKQQGRVNFDQGEETSDRVGSIASRIMRAPETEDIEKRMPYLELLSLAKSVAASAFTQRPDRG